MRPEWRTFFRLLTGICLVLLFVCGDQNMWGIHLAVVSVTFAILALSFENPHNHGLMDQVRELGPRKDPRSD